MFEFTPRQLEACKMVSGIATHNMLFGGSRSGKTFIHIRNKMYRRVNASGSRGATLRFRLNHLKASILEDTLPKVLALCFPDLREGRDYEINKADNCMYFSNRSQEWFGGLDDKARTEKILGQEYADILLNECSQIPWGSRNIAVTRLAQEAAYDDGRPLPLKMIYDCNPPPSNHWAYRVFVEKVDPDSRQPFAKPGNYAALLMNPTDNAKNLPQTYIDELNELPKRMRDRFRDGLWADVNENALFNDDWFERNRARDVPDMVRVVVAVDPSGADDEDNAENDEIGVVVAGLGTDGLGYLLEDVTLKGGPATWGATAASAYERHQADRVVAEQNFGGAMVEHTIRTCNPTIAYKAVTASRGKVVRAEPISALVEQGKIRHLGRFDKLEDELAGFTTTGYTGAGSPNRADAYVWAFTELFPSIVKPRKAPKKKRVQREAVGLL